MSTTPVEPVTGVDTTKAAENAIADADKHTPPAPVTNDPPAPAADPTDGDGKKDDLSKTVADLATQLTTLTGVVTDLVAKNVPADVSPTARVPWTHKGSRPRGDQS